MRGRRKRKQGEVVVLPFVQKDRERWDGGGGGGPRQILILISKMGYYQPAIQVSRKDRKGREIWELWEIFSVYLEIRAIYADTTFGSVIEESGMSIGVSHSTC